MAWVSCTPEKFVRLMVLEDGKTKVEEPSLVSVFYCVSLHGQWHFTVRGMAVSCLSKTELTFVTKQH